MQAFHKTIDLGKVDGYRINKKNCQVRITIKIIPLDPTGRDIDLNPAPPPAECGRLSVTGKIWNHIRTDIISGGQNQDEIARHFPDSDRVRRIIEIWNRWHLNDMNAGTRAQRDYLATIPDIRDYPAACAALDSAGLLVDRGYRYGTEWLYEPIEPKVIAEIKDLFS